MIKIILGFLVTILTLVFAPTALAQNMMHQSPHPIAHSYTPMVMTMDSQNWLKAKVVNWAGGINNPLVCVEAWSGSSKTHLGCLKVDPTMNAEFNAPLYNLRSGSYSIVYNYQDNQGMWHQTTNVQDMLIPVSVTVR